MRSRKRFWLLVLTLVLAAILRLRNFPERIVFGSDTARDLLVAHGAVALHELPWVGSFSSAGPFVFGPQWYHFLMVPAALFPHLFYAPWVLMLGISLLFIVVMYLSARALGGARGGLTTALLTAVSPLMLGFSLYLTQHGLVGIFAALALWGFIQFVLTGKSLWAAFCGGAVGVATALHYQGLSLFLYFPVMLAARGLATKSVKSLVAPAGTLVLGLLVGLGPLLLWDAGQGFSNFNNLLYYFREGQYRIWTSSRWLTYAFVFWPDFLGQFLGGGMFFGPLLGVGLMLAAFGAFLFGRFSPAVFGVFLVFAGQVFLLRYLRGEKFPGYLVYLHPIVLLLLGSGLDHLSRWGKRAGGLALLVVILISISAAVLTADRTHNDARRLWEMEKTVAARLAGEGVAVYGKGLATSNGSFSLALLLQNEGLMNDNGRAVGVCLYSLEACDEKNIREIARTEFQGQIYVAADLSGVEKGRLIKDNNWYPFSTLAVFADVQHWWRK